MIGTTWLSALTTVRCHPTGCGGSATCGHNDGEGPDFLLTLPVMYREGVAPYGLCLMYMGVSDADDVGTVGRWPTWSASNDPETYGEVHLALRWAIRLPLVGRGTQFVDRLQVTVCRRSASYLLDIYVYLWVLRHSVVGASSVVLALLAPACTGRWARLGAISYSCRLRPLDILGCTSIMHL